MDFAGEARTSPVQSISTAPLAEKRDRIPPRVASVAGFAQAVADAFLDQGSGSAGHQTLQVGEGGLAGAELPGRRAGVIGVCAAWGNRTTPG